MYALWHTYNNLRLSVILFVKRKQEPISENYCKTMTRSRGVKEGSQGGKQEVKNTGKNTPTKPSFSH